MRRARRTPVAFAALLARLGIPHPDVAPAPLPGPGLWLLEAARRLGRRPYPAVGRSPGRASGAMPSARGGRAARRRLPGRRPHGADPRRHRAMERPVPPCALALWRRHRAGCDGAALSPAILAALARALAEIVAATGLRGLASADILVDGGRWWLLEINPRPGATLDVLDRRATAAARGATSRRAQDSSGRLRTAPATAARQHDLLRRQRRSRRSRRRIGPTSSPTGRAPARKLPPGAPICTVLADGPTAAAVASIADGGGPTHVLRRAEEQE